MELETVPYSLTVCKAASASDIDLAAPCYFIGRTDEELSLVCRSEEVPAGVTEREDGWRGFRIRGRLDFSAVGILAALTGVLAGRGIGLFAVSTFNTDYILVKERDFARALEALAAEGYGIL